jgi:hypothetical protein
MRIFFVAASIVQKRKEIGLRSQAMLIYVTARS